MLKFDPFWTVHIAQVSGLTQELGFCFTGTDFEVLTVLTDPTAAML